MDMKRDRIIRKLLKNSVNITKYYLVFDLNGKSSGNIMKFIYYLCI